MPLSTTPNPYRFVDHLPPGLRATTLEDAHARLEELLGPGREEALGEGLTALQYDAEDRTIRLLRDAGTGALVAIQSRPTAAVQLFIRPCSGPAGAMTATGMATGSVFLVSFLIPTARARATLMYGRMLVALPNLCMPPCFTVPLGPYPSGIGITVVARFFGIPITVTVTYDLSARLWCV